MQRRNFLKNGLAAGAASLFTGSLLANETIKANKDFNDQIKFAYDQGFRSIEDNGMMGRTPEMQKKIGDTLAKLGMSMGVFVVDKGGNGANTLAAGKPEFIEIFLKGCRNSIEVAKRC